MSSKAVDRIKARYFRKVMAFPEGGVVHFGDCMFYTPGCVCNCGLHIDLMPLLDKEIKELYSKYWEEREKSNV